MLIGCMQRVDVPAPHVAGSLKIGAAPSETRTALPGDQQISR